MSHWTTVNAEIRDIDSLEEALKKLGYKNIKRKTTARGWGGSTHACDLVIVGVRENFDIGFKLDGKGNTSIEADFSALGLNPDDFRKKVLQKYSYCKILKALKRKGLTAREKVEKDGTIKLVVSIANGRYADADA